MTTYDIVLLLATVVWWFCFRKKYEWGAVVLFYLGGVMLTDIFCAILIAIVYHSHPNVILLPAVLMPLGGIGGIVCGASKKQLIKGTGLFVNSDEKPDAPSPRR